MSNTDNFEKFKYFKMDSLRLGKLAKTKKNLSQKGLNLEEEKWVLLEKIHGSNSCFIYQYQDEEPNYQLGRRNGLVPKKELRSFYNIETAYQPWVEQLKNMCEAACYEMGFDPRHHQVVVYSELYGANIQKGMRYHDQESILVFDIRVDDTFLCYDKMRQLCQDYGIPSTPLIAEGTLDELVESFRDKLEGFTSQVPQKIHQQETNDAPAEGVILRPIMINETYDPFYKSSYMLRYKWKKTEFTEHPQKKEIPREQMTRPEYLLVQATEFLNAPRLATYQSKVGVDYLLDMNNMGANIRALVQDTLVDIKEEDEYQFIFEEKKLQSELQKMLSRKSSSMIQKFQFDYIPSELSEMEKLDKIDSSIQTADKNIQEIRKKVEELKRRTIFLSK